MAASQQKTPKKGLSGFHITLIAPVTLVFVALCAAATLIGALTGGLANRAVFSTYFTSFLDPMFYVRLFTHVLGHASWSHFAGNAIYLLLLGPLLEPLGIPRELAPLLLIRPLSGSAALAVGAELITTHGPDSAVGRTAAVVLGSTETTFYAICVYFGAAGVEKSRYAVPAALAADLAGFLMGALSIRLFF